MAKKTSTKVSLGGVPRARLMPPEVEQRRALRATGRAVVRLVIFALVVVAGVYGATVLWSTTTQASLTSAQDQTQSLLLQQGDYSAATQTTSSIAQITEALAVTTSSEVNWSELYGVVSGDLPEGSRITAAIFTGRAPFDGALVPPSPLSAPRVAYMAITVALVSPDDAADLVESLKAEDTVADVTLVDIGGVSGQYIANFRVDFNSTALSQRFAGEAVAQ